TDVFLMRGGRSLANGQRILLQFLSPQSKKSEDAVAQVLTHEWGHYFYDLPDEYSEPHDLGWCADSKYNSPAEACSGFPTSSCASGARCIRHGACVNDGGMYDGYYLDDDDEWWSLDKVEAWGVVSPSQCKDAGGSGPHAVCVLNDPAGKVSFPFGGPAFWPNWGMECHRHSDCDSVPKSGEGRCTEEMPTEGWV